MMKGKSRTALMSTCMAVILIFSVLLYGCAPSESQNGDLSKKDQADMQNPVSADPLTGQKVNKVIPVTAVMVDNLSAARPQTGLGGAGVVYEIEAEAKITRFMALFAGDPPSVVGPVRSARSYYLQICKEWGAFYAHVGGSTDAIANIQKWGIKDLDQFRGGSEFWRDKSRNAPHNVFLDVEKATAGKEQGLKTHWQFGDTVQGEPDFRSISFSYGSGNNVSYEFSDQDKKYLRYINGSPHSDRKSGKQIKVTNVVVQYASHHSRGDGTACIDVQVIGSGEAEFFLAGEYQEGTWRKDSMDSPTRFYNSNGQEIIFPRGNTWIQVLRPGTMVEKG